MNIQYAVKRNGMQKIKNLSLWRIFFFIFFAMTLYSADNKEYTYDDSHGNNLFIKAAHDGITEIVAFMVDKQADLNSKNKFGDTALMSASLNGHTKTVELLLNARAHANIKNVFGETALSYAVIKGYPDISKKLLGAHADPHAKNNFGISPLERALSKKD